MKKKKDEITIRSSAAEYLTYVATVGDQQDSIEMRYEDENIWLTQKMMATLYDVGLPTINEHIKKIYADSELEESATIRNFRIVQTEGSRQVTRDTKHYNLQMIIAVGFKVNNERAVQFRKWANGIKRFCVFVRECSFLPISNSLIQSGYLHMAFYRREFHHKNSASSQYRKCFLPILLRNPEERFVFWTAILFLQESSILLQDTYLDRFSFLQCSYRIFLNKLNL